MLRRHQWLAAGALLVLLGTSAAWADRARGDRAQATQILAELAKNPRNAKITREPVAESKRALTRANDVRAAGDLPQGELLESLALEWAETGRDVTRAASSEAELAKLQKELQEVEAKSRRAQTMQEETAARRERARSKLEQLKKKAAPPATAPEAKK